MTCLSNNSKTINMAYIRDDLGRKGNIYEDNETHHTVEEYITTDTTKRCRRYLNGYECNKGDFCRGAHRYPHQDGIYCNKIIKREKCNFGKKCWFFHPEMNQNDIKVNREKIEMSVGELIKYIREKGSS